MRGPPLAWRGGNESESRLSAQGERFEGCLDLKGKEQLMLRIRDKEINVSGSLHLLHSAPYSTAAI